jgi:hypothetical protein
MESVLSAFSAINSSLESLILKHQQHSLKLQTLVNTVGEIPQETEKVKMTVSRAKGQTREPGKLEEIMRALNRREADIEKKREACEERLLTDSEQKSTEKQRISAVTESKRQELTSKYLEALKTFK